MIMLYKSEKDLLELAKNESDASILKQLANSMYANVRRVVARNHFTPSDILKQLANDPVLNVAYMAALNPNCIYKRDFIDISHPCVNCEQDERYLDCKKCSLI